MDDSVQYPSNCVMQVCPSGDWSKAAYCGAIAAGVSLRWGIPMCLEHLKICHADGHRVEFWNLPRAEAGEASMSNGKSADSAAALRSSAQLEKAWQLFMALVVKGDTAAMAVELVGDAMEQWEGYVEQHYTEVPPPPSQGLSDRLMRSGFYEPYPIPTVPELPVQEAESVVSEGLLDRAELLGRLDSLLVGLWITRDGSRATVEAKIDPDLYKGRVEGIDYEFQWDIRGHCAEGPPEADLHRMLGWDLVGRAPNPSMRFVPGPDDPLEPLPPPKPPPDLSGEWVTQGGQVVLVTRTPAGPAPYCGGTCRDLDEGGYGLGLYWNNEGSALSAGDYCRMPQYDLAKRVPGEAQPETPAQPEPKPAPKPPLDFSGRWITRGGKHATATPQSRGRFPYSGASEDGYGLFWNTEGRAITPETGLFNAQYDLMERVPSPGGRRMDYPPEDSKKEG